MAENAKLKAELAEAKMEVQKLRDSIALTNPYPQRFIVGRPGSDVPWK
jgi:hypothetical protein